MRPGAGGGGGAGHPHQDARHQQPAQRAEGHDRRVPPPEAAAGHVRGAPARRSTATRRRRPVAKKLKVTLVKSIIGLSPEAGGARCRRSACGASGRSVEHDDTPTVRGMINAVAVRRRRWRSHENRGSAAGAGLHQEAQADRPRPGLRPRQDVGQGPQGLKGAVRRRRAPRASRAARCRSTGGCPSAASCPTAARPSSRSSTSATLAARFAAGSVVDPEALVDARPDQASRAAARSRSWATATWRHALTVRVAQGQRGGPAEARGGGRPRRGAARKGARTRK